MYKRKAAGYNGLGDWVTCAEKTKARSAALLDFYLDAKCRPTAVPAGAVRTLAGSVYAEGASGHRFYITLFFSLPKLLLLLYNDSLCKVLLICILPPVTHRLLSSGFKVSSPVSR